jgi:hypothetical protein
MPPSELSALQYAYTYPGADNFPHPSDLSALQHAYTYLGADNSAEADDFPRLGWDGR